MAPAPYIAGRKTIKYLKGFAFVPQSSSYYYICVLLAKLGQTLKILCFYTAFLNFLFGGIDPGKGQQVVSPPVPAILLFHCGVGKEVNGTLKQVKDVAGLGWDTKRKTLVAAGGLTFKTGNDTPQVGISGFAVFVQPKKHHIVVRRTLVEPPRPDTEVNNIRVDPTSGQVIGSMGSESAGRRQKQCLGRGLFGFGHKNRRLH